MNTDWKKNLLCSATATAVAEVVTLPICTLKTFVQNQPLGTSPSILNCTKTIYRQHGFRGFIHGSSVATAGQIISTSSKYVLYRSLGTWEVNPWKEYRVFNGLVSGVLTTVITHPLDFVKVHWQMKTPIAPVLRKEGASVIYRGYSKTLSKVGLGSMLFFPIYDWLNKDFGWGQSAAAFGSAVMSTCIMQPVDYLKVRHLYHANTHLSWYVKKPWELYRGISLNLMRIVPHFCLVMVITETMRERF